jgi:PAS domain S-box-containing protein
MDCLKQLKGLCDIARESTDVHSLLGEALPLIARVVDAQEYLVYQIDALRFSATPVTTRPALHSPDRYVPLFSRGAFMSIARRLGQSEKPIHCEATDDRHPLLRQETLKSMRDELGVRAFLWRPVPYGNNTYFLMMFHRERTRKRWQRYMCEFASAAGDVIGSALTRFSIVDGYRKALDEVRVQKSLYESVVQDQTELICRHLPDGTLTFVNHAFCRYFLRTREDLTGGSFLSQIHPEDVAKAENLILSLSASNPVVDLEARTITADGSLRWLHWIDRAMYDDAGLLIGMQAVGRDITEQKDLEKQLSHAKKMESVGTMAGAIAHDFNNFLTSISGCAQLLRMEFNEGALQRDLLQQIVSTSERASVLVRDLLTFSRKSSPKREPFDLTRAVQESEGLLSSLLSEEIKLETLHAPEGLQVSGDSSQIAQVLMNLASNARDAMPFGGMLRLATARVSLGHEEMRSWGYGSPGEYALITVSDDGAGMDEETRERIFEPFFTTKGLGKGTGLGLSIVYGIVKDHGGFIRCESEPGRGTVFSIYLPLTATA